MAKNKIVDLTLLTREEKIKAIRKFCTRSMTTRHRSKNPVGVSIHDVCRKFTLNGHGGLRYPHKDFDDETYGIMCELVFEALKSSTIKENKQS